MTSIGSQSSLNFGKSSSNLDYHMESPLSDPHQTTTTPSWHRARKARESPLPIRAAQHPKSPATYRPKYNTPTTRADVFSQPTPGFSISTAGPSTPTRSATVPGLPGPSTSRAPGPSTVVRAASTPAIPTAPGPRASPPSAPALPPFSPRPPAAPQPVATQHERVHPVSVDAFLQRDPCPDLAYHIIAYNEGAQAGFDALKIEWGVQFQLARGQTIGLWTWDQVIASMDKLRGTNEESGPQVLAVMLPEKASNATDHRVW